MEANRDTVKQVSATRRLWPPCILFSVPGAKHYNNSSYSNRSYSFVSISITGDTCACRCAHCNAKLLQTMIPAATPEEMCRIVDRLVLMGCHGILVSGGANSNGEVPLLLFREALKYAKQQGLRVIVHSGLIRPETAASLKQAGVDQVLLDVIGHERTIREVYHLDLKPVDYLESMMACYKAGLQIAPHVVIGLHFGQILGEMRALEMIRGLNAQTLVLVILSPVDGTDMALVEPPPVEEVAKVIAAARLWNPHTPLALGCARPPGLYKRQIERIAIDFGVNIVAYPDESTVVYAQEQDLKTKFFEECCSLTGTKLMTQIGISDLRTKFPASL